MPGFRRCESIQTLHIAVRQDDLVRTLVVVYYEYHTSTSMMLNAALIAMEHEKQSMPNVLCHRGLLWHMRIARIFGIKHNSRLQCTVHSTGVPVAVWRRFDLHSVGRNNVTLLYYYYDTVLQ